MWGTNGSAPAPAPSPAHPTRKGWRSQLRRLIVRPVSYPQTCNPRCTCWFGSPSPGAGLSTWGRPGGSVVETGMAGRDEERALDGEKKLLLPGPLQGVLEEDKPPEPDCPWPRRVSTRHGRSVKRGAGREGYVGSFVCCSWSVNMKKVTHECAGASLQEKDIPAILSCSPPLVVRGPKQVTQIHHVAPWKGISQEWPPIKDFSGTKKQNAPSFTRSLSGSLVKPSAWTVGQDTGLSCAFSPSVTGGSSDTCPSPSWLAGAAFSPTNRAGWHSP